MKFTRIYDTLPEYGIELTKEYDGYSFFFVNTGDFFQFDYERQCLYYFQNKDIGDFRQTNIDTLFERIDTEVARYGECKVEIKEPWDFEFFRFTGDIGGSYNKGEL